MRRRVVEILLAIAAVTIAAGFSDVAAAEEAAPIIDTGGETTPAVTAPAPQPGWLERETLTGDWGGGRTWLKERGISLKHRLTQFYQEQTAGDGDKDFEYGSKADLLLNADLDKLGFWKGFSLAVHTEYNFGQSVNARGGAIVPVNTALLFPGMEGSDRYDLSSVYLGQTFGDSVSLVFGKFNMVDMAANRPFAGGAGIDSFWNLVFAAPPTGTIPPYLFGALLSVRTEPATFGFWVYDPNDVVNKSGFEDPFEDGVSFHGSVEFPVSIADRSGHQGFTARFSTMGGTERDINLPGWPETISTKNDRYYFAYTFDQYLYQSRQNPKEGFGLFGQFGISDGNPNRLHWSGHVGVSGTGLIPGRSRDNWGVGYFYAAPSHDLKDSFTRLLRIRDEQGLEIFYNFAVTPWLSLGADLQIIKPSLADDTAVFSGLRMVSRF